MWVAGGWGGLVGRLGLATAPNDPPPPLSSSGVTEPFSVKGHPDPLPLTKSGLNVTGRVSALAPNGLASTSWHGASAGVLVIRALAIHPLPPSEQRAAAQAAAVAAPAAPPLPAAAPEVLPEQPSTVAHAEGRVGHAAGRAASPALVPHRPQCDGRRGDPRGGGQPGAVPVAARHAAEVWDGDRRRERPRQCWVWRGGGGRCL